MEKKKGLRDKISILVKEYYLQNHSIQDFIPGKTPVHYAGRIHTELEMQAAEEALDFWLTEGRFTDRFQSELTAKVGVKQAILVDSRSSANVLVLNALTSNILHGRKLKPGDKVSTEAAGFPTTVNPIIQNNLVPVFVDVHIPTYNINIDDFEHAISPKTRAIFLAHTLVLDRDAQFIC